MQCSLINYCYPPTYRNLHRLFATSTPLPPPLFHAGQQCANSCCRPQSAIVRCAIVYSTALMAALYATCAGSLPCKSFFLAAPAASSTRMHSICASSLTGGLALFFATGASTASAAAAACSGVRPWQSAALTSIPGALESSLTTSLCPFVRRTR